MSAGVLLLTVAGLLVGAGLVAVVAGVRGADTAGAATRPRGRSRPRLTRQRAAALVAGLVVLVVTAWPVAALAAVAGVVFVPRVLGGAAAARREIERAEGLAEWTRRLADLIASGAAGSTREALRRSVSSVPAVLADAVGNLVHRMGPQGTEHALRAFAREVGDPAADRVAMVLILRERNGGPGLADVLTALAEDLDERTRIVREVEAERAKPRGNMRTIVVVTFALVVGMILFARGFLSGYSSPLGQVGLAAVAALFAVSLRWMRRLSEPPPVARLLVDLPAQRQVPVRPGVVVLP